MTWDFTHFLQRTLVSIISSSIVHKKNGCDNLHSVLVEPVSRFQPKLRNCLSNHGWVQCSSSSLTFDQIIVPFAATPVGWLKWVVQSIGTTFGLYGLGLPIGFPSIVMDDLAWSLMKCLSLHFSSDISDNNAERIDNSETINLTTIFPADVLSTHYWSSPPSLSCWEVRTLNRSEYSQLAMTWYSHARNNLMAFSSQSYKA